MEVKFLYKKIDPGLEKAKTDSILRIFRTALQREAMNRNPAKETPESPMAQHFLTVHDFNLSPEETKIWGGVGRTADTYPTTSGMQPQDAALCHIVHLLLDRGDHSGADQHAAMIQDHRVQAMMQTVINQRRRQSYSKPES
jgi:hypothetical protein